MVRPARAADVPAVVAVVAAVAEEGGYLLTEPPVDRTALETRMRATLDTGEGGSWVLEHEGAVVGTLGLQPTGAAGVGAIGMAILPSARGLGGGRRLLEAAIAGARARDLHKVELEVFPDNARAIALYARCGFAVEGLRREHHRRRDGSRRSVLLMARLLEDAPRGTPDPAGGA